MDSVPDLSPKGLDLCGPWLTDQTLKILIRASSLGRIGVLWRVGCGRGCGRHRRRYGLLRRNRPGRLCQTCWCREQSLTVRQSIDSGDESLGTVVIRPSGNQKQRKRAEGRVLDLIGVLRQRYAAPAEQQCEAFSIGLRCGGSGRQILNLDQGYIDKRIACIESKDGIQI